MHRGNGIAVLEGAIALLSVPGAWIQKEYAQDASGNPCSVYSEEAVRHCKDGALMRAAMLYSPQGLMAARRLVYDELAARGRRWRDPRAIWAYNDKICKNQRQALALLRAALKGA